MLLLIRYPRSRERISTDRPRRSAFGQSILNDSTSRFPYPCLVHVLLVFLQAWTMPSSSSNFSNWGWSQRLMAVSLRLQPALLPSSSRLRRTPVSTGSRKIAYLSEFVLHRRYYKFAYQLGELLSRLLSPNTYSIVRSEERR